MMIDNNANARFINQSFKVKSELKHPVTAAIFSNYFSFQNARRASSIKPL